jgi:hypothetical protein
MATKRKKTVTKKTAGEIDLSKPIPRKGRPPLRPSPERGTIPFDQIVAAVKEVLAARGALKKQ